MKKTILAICTFFLFTAFNAQEKEMSLSLDEAIAYALEHSYNTKAARNDIILPKKKFGKPLPLDCRNLMLV